MITFRIEETPGDRTLVFQEIGEESELIGLLGLCPRIARLEKIHEPFMILWNDEEVTLKDIKESLC